MLRIQLGHPNFFQAALKIFLKNMNSLAKISNLLIRFL